MGRRGYIFLGLILFAVAAGVLGYRLMHEGDALARYSWIVGEENAAPEQERSASRPQASPGADSLAQARRVEGGGTRQEKLNNMKLLELGLDIANVLVGLIGIVLAISGMRMRREARS